MKKNNTIFRWMLGIGCLISLLLFFLFQKADISSLFGIEHPTSKFIFTKSVRFLVNDFLMIGLIYSIFRERKYVIFAVWVQAAGMLFILLPYFLLKLVWHTGNGPLVSFLHRLVLNPTLLILLIPAFYYQRLKKD